MKLLITCTIAAFALSLADTAEARFRWKPKSKPAPTGGVPEPSSALGLLGAAGILALRRRRK